MGLLHLDVLTASGQSLDANLDWWADSPRRRSAANASPRKPGVDPGRVIMDADTARRNGLSSTLVFPTGNLAPEGALVKATAIDPSVIGEQSVYRLRGAARVFTSEHAPSRR